MSDDNIKASTAAGNLNLSPTDDTEMAEVDGEGDRGEVKKSLAHTGDSDDEYFDVEDIKSCKLDSRVRRFSAFSVSILTITLFF
jgi:hypothetical protein